MSVLPLPDSPSVPTTWPRASEKLTPPTTRAQVCAWAICSSLASYVKGYQSEEVYQEALKLFNVASCAVGRELAPRAGVRWPCGSRFDASGLRSRS
ncbi:MAG TPA: hypothetical protein VFX59_30675 [Polyangiales bacterium]|nr:hypothetical protein [Polyangiales bacterium]